MTEAYLSVATDVSPKYPNYLGSNSGLVTGNLLILIENWRTISRNVYKDTAKEHCGHEFGNRKCDGLRPAL